MSRSKSMAMDRPVLVLNASYEPIRFAATWKALKMVLKGVAKIEVPLELEREVRHGLMYPSVVRLLEYRRLPHIRVQPKKRNICMRDGYRCQYCGEMFRLKDLTLDHIIPRAQGGPSTWDNLVAACGPCNRFKDDRTPEEAGMKLLHRPRPASIHTSRQMLRCQGGDNSAWRPYLYY